MSLTRPALVWLLLLAVPQLSFEFLRVMRLKPAIKALWGSGAARSWRRRRAAAAWLRALALASIVFCLAGPVSGTRAVRSWTRGLDAVILLDVSRSMNVQDGDSTRLETAVRRARAFMDRLDGARFALTVFKGGALTVFPLSDDRDSIDEFLDSAGSHLLSDKGSDLEAAVREAVKACSARSATSRAIILLSDGESLSGSLEKAAEAAREAGISIHAVGFGDERGGAVPENEGIKSKRNRQSLRFLCRSTGGQYADEDNARALRGMEAALVLPLSATGNRSLVLSRVDGSLPFILCACLCLALSALAGRARSLPEWPRARARPGRKTVVLAVFLLAGLCGCARSASVFQAADALMLASSGRQPEAVERLLKVLPRVSGEDADAVKYDLALCYCALGETEPAYELLKSAAASTSLSVSANAWYCLGCLQFADSSYRDAWESFRQSLRRAPDSQDAQVNLELAWERMEKEGGVTARQPHSAQDKGGAEGESEEFDLIRKAERDRFRNSIGADEGSGRDDY
jgi:Ca-activated chloride channel family protein